MSDLASLYGVPTFRFNEAVKRNLDRFPKDFMFRLTQRLTSPPLFPVLRERASRDTVRRMTLVHNYYGRLKLGRWALTGVLMAGGLAQAEGFRLESVGARYGFSANSSRSDFQQAEAFANWNLPWSWDLGAQWRLQSRLDLSAGWLGNSDADAAVGTLGPTLVVGRERLPISLEGGVSPTALSQYTFGSENLGLDFQFTSHVGINWDLPWHLRVGYRFQHMSNAGFAHPNPGLNMHMFGVSYRF